MSEARWIEVVGWEKFQHYGNRRPVWIKVYTNLLDNPRYLGLTGKQRGILFSLWLLYAASDCEVPASAAYVAQRIGGLSEWEYRQMRERGESDVSELREAREFVVRGTDLKALEQAGFIRFVASRPLAQSKRESKTPQTPHRGAAPNPRKPKTTGWRLVRGSHGMTHVPDPNGTDKPPTIGRPL